MEKPNRSIECTLNECKHHCSDCDYCSLATVHIGTHEPNPTVEECVDCRSFCLK